MNLLKIGLIVFTAVSFMCGKGIYSKIYSRDLNITKSFIKYDSLLIKGKIDLNYPKYYRPISFEVNTLVAMKEPMLVLYGWKVLNINKFVSKDIETLFLESFGPVIVKNIYASNLSNIKIGKFANFVYLGLKDLNKSKVLLVKIDSVKKVPKEVIIKNDTKAHIYIKCSLNNISLIYLGNSDLIVSEGCKINLGNRAKSKTENKLKAINNKISKKDVQEIFNSSDLKKVLDKYMWIKSKDLTYVIKYKVLPTRDKIGVIFGVSLKDDSIITKIPKRLLEKIKVKKIFKKNGKTYYLFENSNIDSIIINHVKYDVHFIKVE